MKNILLLLTTLIALIILLGCGDEGDKNHFQPLSVEESPELSLADDALASPLAAKVLRSTVFIAAYTSDGRQIGSGFVCAPQTICTSLHLVESDTPITVLVQDLISKEFYIADESVGQDLDNDIILFTVKDYPAPPLIMDDSDACFIGQRIFVASNPKGAKGTFSTGIISSIREEPIGTFIKGKSLQISAPVSAGSSGGPVVNELGNVVGIVSSSLPNGNDLTFVTPSNALTALLQSIVAATELED